MSDPSQDGSRSPLDPRLSSGLTALAVLLIGVGLALLALPVPRSWVMVGMLVLCAGNSVGAWLHTRQRGKIPVRWLAAALGAAVLVLAVPSPVQGRAALVASAAASAGMLLRAWHRPIEALVPMGSIATVLAGHFVLAWVAGWPDGDATRRIIKLSVLFGGTGSLVVGTSATWVWCREALGERGEPPAFLRLAAWAALGVAVVCMALLTVVPIELPQPLLRGVWAVAGAVHVGVLSSLLAITLRYMRHDAD